MRKMKQVFCTLALVAAIFSSCQQAPTTNAAAASSEAGASASLGIAYVNTDSLLNNYEYAKKLSDTMNDKAENARASSIRRLASSSRT